MVGKRMAGNKRVRGASGDNPSYKKGRLSILGRALSLARVSRTKAGGLGGDRGTRDMERGRTVFGASLIVAGDQTGSDQPQNVWQGAGKGPPMCGVDWVPQHLFLQIYPPLVSGRLQS